MLVNKKCFIFLWKKIHFFCCKNPFLQCKILLFFQHCQTIVADYFYLKITFFIRPLSCRWMWILLEVKVSKKLLNALWGHQLHGEGQNNIPCWYFPPFTGLQDSMGFKEWVRYFIHYLFILFNRFFLCFKCFFNLSKVQPVPAVGGFCSHFRRNTGEPPTVPADAHFCTYPRASYPQQTFGRIPALPHPAGAASGPQTCKTQHKLFGRSAWSASAWPHELPHIRARARCVSC